MGGLRIRLSQPNLAEVGVGAELGKIQVVFNTLFNHYVLYKTILSTLKFSSTSKQSGFDVS